MTRDLYGNPNYRVACEKCGEKFRSRGLGERHEASCSEGGAR